MSPAFLARFAEKFRRKSPRDKQAADWPEIGEDGLLAEPAELPDAGETGPVPGKPAGPLARWAKREQTLARLQEGYDHVTQVIDEIHKHLILQGERAERVSTSLEQLARSMGDLPAIARQQARTLEAITGQLETTNNRTQQLTEAVGEIPKAARAQTETLAGINRHLEVAGEQSVVAAQTTEKLSAAIDTLGEANTTHAQALEQMNTKVAEQNEMLTQLIARQSRRFIMLFIVTVALAAAAVATAIVGLILRGG